MESPRGRLYLLSLWDKGELALEDGVAEHINSCLGCFGCQTACPSGVQYERILNQARPYLKVERKQPLRFALYAAFKYLLPNYFLLRIVAFVIRLWQSSKGRQLLQRLSGLEGRMLGRRAAGAEIRGAAEKASLLPLQANCNLLEKLAVAELFIPNLPPFRRLKRRSWMADETKGTAQLFSGCVMDVFYNDVNHDASELLQKEEFLVEVPEQTCCGALAFHAGEVEIARELASKNIQCFEKTSGPIVVTSAGCGAMLKEYGELFGADPQWSLRAHEFASRVKDLSEVLAQREMPLQTRKAARAPASKVAYHAACHLAHAQNVRRQPAKLLYDLAAAVDTKSNTAFGSEKERLLMDVVPLAEAEHCCGSAGIFNLLNPDLSLKVLQRKVEKIEESGADVVVTTNPGCLLQLETGARLSGANFKVKHLATFLNEGYRQK